MRTTAGGCLYWGGRYIGVRAHCIRYILPRSYTSFSWYISNPLDRRYSESSKSLVFACSISVFPAWQPIRRSIMLIIVSPPIPLIITTPHCSSGRSLRPAAQINVIESDTPCSAAKLLALLMQFSETSDAKTAAAIPCLRSQTGRWARSVPTS